MVRMRVMEAILHFQLTVQAHLLEPCTSTLHEQASCQASPCTLLWIHASQWSSAVQYADLTPDEPAHWRYRFPILYKPANVCQMCDDA